MDYWDPFSVGSLLASDSLPAVDIGLVGDKLLVVDNCEVPRRPVVADSYFAVGRAPAVDNWPVEVRNSAGVGNPPAGSFVLLTRVQSSFHSFRCAPSESRP